ncbi:Uncharacterised protein [Streptococcus pneumoniae]|nr:Uncharacterised protein [Streptococcus pneumoniae]
MPAPERDHLGGEVHGPVVVAVVRDHPVDPDPVGGEERPRPAEEPDRGHRFLVLQRLGVGQAGEPVDRRVQVGVADPSARPALGCSRVLGVPAVSTPAAPLGDAPDLLHVQVHHVPRPSRGDLLGSLAQVFSGRGQVP